MSTHSSELQLIPSLTNTAMESVAFTPISPSSILETLSVANSASDQGNDELLLQLPGANEGLLQRKLPS